MAALVPNCKDPKCTLDASLLSSGSTHHPDNVCPRLLVGCCGQQGCLQPASSASIRRKLFHTEDNPRTRGGSWWPSTILGLKNKQYKSSGLETDFFPSYLLCTPSLAVPLFFLPWLFNVFLVISYTLAPCQDFSETCRMHIPKSKPWSVLALT